MANVITTLLKLDGTQFKSGMKQVQDQVRQTDGIVSKAKVGISGLFSSFASSPTALLGAATAASAVAAKAINDASDLEESINAVNVTFGESADKILEFGKSAATSVGLAQAEFNQLATPLGSILKNFGLPISEVADQTLVLTQRAADMASVFNTDVSTALTAIQAGLRGEQDPLERFGVSLSAAKVQTRALADTGKDSVSALTEQEKALARVELILEQTNATAGDFANTSDSLANQQRKLKAQITNLSAALGKELIPKVSEAVGELNQLAEGAIFAQGALNDLTNTDVAGWVERSFGRVTNPLSAAKGAINDIRDFARGSFTPFREEVDRGRDSLAEFDETAGRGADAVSNLSEAVEQGSASWAGYFGAVGQATSAVGGAHGDYLQMKDDLEAINEEARDNALNELADAAKAVGEAVSEAFDGVRDSLDIQDLLDDITDQFAEVAEAQDKMAEDGEEGVRNYNRSVRDLQRQLLTLLEDIHSIPPDKKVAIAAEIQRGGIDELFAILAELSKGVIVPATITPQTSPAFSSVQGVFSQSAIPSGPIFQGVTQPPATVDQRTINFYYPVGTTPTTQYQNGILDRLRNGERTSL